MRKFEKISFEQWQKDINDDRKLYDSFELPMRQTKYSAGYDFRSPIAFILKPGEVKKVPTGVKIQMNEDELLMILVQSSMGFQYNVRLTNQVGLFESDYYNNETNEGHAWISLQNHGDQDFVVHVGDRIGQGVFQKFLTVEDESEIKNTRTGGLGSTDRRN